MNPTNVIRHYRTRWKVLIKSHQYNGTLNIFDSIINLSSSKNTKTVGNLSLALTAETNLLNKIYPNDYISAYCDRGDGQGWIRVFFGFVDMIEESQRVEAATGKPVTMYTLQCSDFQKAFERTEIYFNPFIAARGDFDGSFVGTPNIAGAALRTRGIRVFGSPADLVLNSTLLLLGFGSQFILPISYNPRVMGRIRQQRADFILSTLPTDVRDSIMNMGGYANYLDSVRNRLGITNDVRAIIDPSSTGAAEVSAADRDRFSNAVARTLVPGSSTNQESTRAPLERGQEAYNVLNTTVTQFPATLLDIIDIFTFVERDAIDGYTMEMTIWERQGTLMSLLKSISNDIVNELFLDLRPVSRDGGLVAGDDYSRDSDDLGGNEADNNGGTTGIMYQPALVMREYPFSTIDRIDASNVTLSVREVGTTPVSEGSNDQKPLAKIGNINFGAIFSNDPNVPGRHVITIPTINAGSISYGSDARTARKHLDVAVVNSSEISTTRFSRSDTDHFNLFELTSESAIFGESSRFFFQDLLPIITPTHIVRHGLRTRRVSTRFARPSLDIIDRLTPQSPPAAAEESTAAAAAPTPPVSTPVTFLPIDLVIGSDGVYTQGYVHSRNLWQYRQWNSNGTRPLNNITGNPIPARGTPYWRFHNGVDFVARRGTPVRAVRAGKVVMAAPDNIGASRNGGYGNVVMIYHEQDDIYSLYAHLDTIAENLNHSTRSTRTAHFQSARIVGGGRYQEVDVAAGDIIGTVGQTGTDSGGPHLHFEFIVKRNARVYPTSIQRTGTPRRPGGLLRDFLVNKESDNRDIHGNPITGFSISSSRPSNPPESETLSQDPVRIFLERFGKIVPVNSTVIPDEEVVNDAEGGEGVDLVDNRPAPTPESTQPDEGEKTERPQTAGHVDGPSSRRILARWALLQDHWYQHNLEYVSGNIEMRGAPEIRAGYRLDLPDRNMSFYIEGVSHQWSYGQPMTTTLQVTRGQPNNPFPVYVLPATAGFNNVTDTQRKTGSRLSAFFVSPDPLSVRRALKLQRRSNNDPTADLLPVSARASQEFNETDAGVVSSNIDGTSTQTTVGARYNEGVIEAVTAAPVDIDAEVAEAERILRRDLPSTSGTGTLAGGFSNNPLANSEAAQVITAATETTGEGT